MDWFAINCSTLSPSSLPKPSLQSEHPSLGSVPRRMLLPPDQTRIPRACKKLWNACLWWNYWEDMTSTSERVVLPNGRQKRVCLLPRLLRRVLRHGRSDTQLPTSPFFSQMISTRKKTSFTRNLALGGRDNALDGNTPYIRTQSSNT